MKNLFTSIFPLLVLALLFALTSSGNVYALKSPRIVPNGAIDLPSLLWPVGSKQRVRMYQMVYFIRKLLNKI